MLTSIKQIARIVVSAGLPLAISKNLYCWISAKYCGGVSHDFNHSVCTNTTCIILCNGENFRCGGYQNTPRKHLVTIEGEILLDRTLRMAANFKPDRLVVVINERDFDLYASRLSIPCEFHKTPEPIFPQSEAYKLLTSKLLWNRFGRTILLNGNVWFSEEAISRIFAPSSEDWMAFGRAGASRFTGCPYGKLFAQSFISFLEHEKQLLRLDAMYRQGTCKRQAAEWAHYQLMIGGDPNVHSVGSNFVEIDDFTDYLDSPIDYETWVFGRSVYKKIKNPPNKVVVHHFMKTPVPANVDGFDRVSCECFDKQFHCGPMTLPRNVVLLGWSPYEKKWQCAPDNVERDGALNLQLPATLYFLRCYVMPRLDIDIDPFWLMFCYWDGWRERTVFSKQYRWVEGKSLESFVEWQGEPGDLPIMGDRRWLACYCAHRGDPSALLFPEAHYLRRNYYRSLFSETALHQIPWSVKQNRAIYCGGNHGERENYFPPLIAERPHPRQYLQEIALNLPIDVYLNQKIPMQQQIGYKYILDVDGYTRTWDAWAWKMQSGSVVLSVESLWESFFTKLFRPWMHYVPVANDFSDLGEKIAWCMSHDKQCQDIAHQGGLRAKDVYDAENVAQRVAESLKIALSGK